MTKLGVVMHHQELECHAKRAVGYFEGQGHSKGSYDQNMTDSTIFFGTADPFATRLNWIAHCHKLDCFVKVQNFVESSCVLYLLYH